MNYTIHFVEILKDYLERNSLTITEFAANVGMTEAGLSKWMTGKSYPSLIYLIKVADFFDCSLDYLVGRSEIADYVSATQKQNFCNRLDYLLTTNNKTFYQLAKACKFGCPIYAKWKKGKKPKPENLISIADYFNVSLDYLVGRSDSV